MPQKIEKRADGLILYEERAKSPCHEKIKPAIDNNKLKEPISAAGKGIQCSSAKASESKPVTQLVRESNPAIRIESISRLALSSSEMGFLAYSEGNCST